jgi:hypothetical protein
MELLMSALVIGTSVWVAVDASNLCVRRGSLGGGFLDIGVAGWFFACLLLWIVAFPAYLVVRPRHVARKQVTDRGAVHPPPSAAFGTPPGGARFTPASQWPQTPTIQGTSSYYAAGGAPAQPSRSSVGEELSRLSALRDDGALTQEEFDTLKARLLQS